MSDKRLRTLEFAANLIVGTFLFCLAAKVNLALALAAIAIGTLVVLRYKHEGLKGNMLRLAGIIPYALYGFIVFHVVWASLGPIKEWPILHVLSMYFMLQASIIAREIGEKP